LVLEDKVTDLMDLYQTNYPELYGNFKVILEFLDSFHEKVELKISSLRSK
jgi:hypothetical protein